MRASLLAVALFGGAGALAGVGGRGGLEAVAVSPDGKLVAVGGQNRVVYLLDADTFEVRQRLPVGTRVGGLAFGGGGKRLAVEDEEDTLRLFDLATAKEVAKVEGVTGLVAHAGRAAVRDTRVFEGGLIRLLSLDDLKEVGKVELTWRPAAWAFAAGGRQLLALSLAQPGGEKRAEPSAYPPNLTGLAREQFRQQNDGLESVLELRDLQTGKVLEQARLWYTSDSDSTVLARAGKAVHVLNRGNACARVEAGKAKLYATGLFLNHAIGVSPDGSRLVLGGGGGGLWGKVGGPLQPFTVGSPPGQAEYFTRFAVGDSGPAFGVTTAFRVVRLSKDGKAEKVAAVY